LPLSWNDGAHDDRRRTIAFLTATVWRFAAGGPRGGGRASKPDCPTACCTTVVVRPHELNSRRRTWTSRDDPDWP